MLELRHLSKQWDHRPLLSDVSLRIDAGETVALLGASGSGKSTLLKMVAGLEVPESGSVWFDGQDITGLPPEERGFALMFQDFALFPHLSVQDNVAFGLVDERLPPATLRTRVEEALGSVNLSTLQLRPIYALSGGQKQRVAIAGAIARRCEILLLDEPTPLLDPDSQLDLVAGVRRLVKSRGITALWVTHRLDELNYCDGAFLLEKGCLIDKGEPQRLKQRLMTMDDQAS